MFLLCIIFQRIPRYNCIIVFLFSCLFLISKLTNRSHEIIQPTFRPSFQTPFIVPQKLWLISDWHPFFQLTQQLLILLWIEERDRFPTVPGTTSPAYPVNVLILVRTICSKRQIVQDGSAEMS